MQEYTEKIDQIKKNHESQEEEGENVKSIDSIRVEGLRVVEKLKEDIEETKVFQIKSHQTSKRRK